LVELLFSCRALRKSACGVAERCVTGKVSNVFGLRKMLAEFALALTLTEVVRLA